MKVESKFNDIIIDNGKLIVNQFQTSDQDVVNYFDGVEHDKRHERLANMLKIGVVTTQTISRTDNVHYVEKVLGRLGHELSSKMMELKEEIRVKETRNAIENKTPLKGQRFEERCEIIINEVARHFGDLVENTTTKEGIIRYCKKGDYIITHAENKKKIVFELKDIASISITEIQKTLEKSIENRGASYGILVVRSVEALPKFVGWFQEYGNNMLVCALSSHENDDDHIHPELLLIAYKWARLRIVLQDFKEEKIDVRFIQEKVKKIQHKISELRTIKTQCSNIEISSDKIRTIAKYLEDEIGRELSDILGSIKIK